MFLVASLASLRPSLHFVERRRTRLAFTSSFRITNPFEPETLKNGPRAPKTAPVLRARRFAIIPPSVPMDAQLWGKVENESRFGLAAVVGTC